MAQGAKKLFKVAKEYNVSTSSIVETLAEKGFKVENKISAKLTSDMISALDEVYGIDKKKHITHEKNREEYHEMRNQYKARANQSVSLEDNFGLEPMDSLTPIDEPTSDGPSLEPQDEPLPLEPQDVIEPKVEEPVIEAVEEKEGEPQPEVVEEPEIEVEPEKVETQDNQVDEIKQEERVEVESQKEESVEDKKADTEHALNEIEEPKAEEVKTDSTHDVDPNETIRAKTEKLEGTKVIGKISIRNDFDKKSSDSSKSKKDRKNKRRKGEPKPAGSSSPEKIKSKEDSSDSASKKKKKRLKKAPPSDQANKKAKGGNRGEVNEQEVDKKMRETMMRMQSSEGKISKKRSKLRKKKRDDAAAEREEAAALAELQSSTVLEVAEFVTASDLAELLGVSVNEIITSLMTIGIMVSINQRLDASTIELVAGEFGKEAKFITADELLEEDIEEEVDKEEDLEPRAPVVTIMGHVDHGKTSLLDYIRDSIVAAGEAGGITQHIGAYSVKVQDEKYISFLDTPGHEAFTAMRARGAQVTDIVILVVAADDSVMPQTVEAINHAQAAGVPLIVAINKIDKPDANPDKIKQQLTEHNVVVEDYGGSVQTALVSAKMGTGIDELLDKVLIEAELLELKANPNKKATGIILESRVDKGKGVVANVLIQAGTMHVGDIYVAGQHFGRVRAMENEKGNRLKEAGPSTPIQLTGFDGLPQAGDKIQCLDDERKAKEIAAQRQQIKREQSIRMVKHMTLDDLSRRMALGEVSDLNIIIKGDVDGSIEALSGSLLKLSTDEVQVQVIHTGVGAITESDVMLASASDAIIIGFQVRPTANARKIAEQESIDVRLFSVIYDAVDEVKEAMEGLLSPELKEKVLATVEVRDTFRITGVGTIAGCYVTEGKIMRNAQIRLIRDGIVIFDGEIMALKRFKEDVKEVASGYECGISIRNYNDIKVSDIIEAYETIEIKRTL